MKIPLSYSSGLPFLGMDISKVNQSVLLEAILDNTIHFLRKRVLQVFTKRLQILAALETAQETKWYILLQRAGRHYPFEHFRCSSRHRRSNDDLRTLQEQSRHVPTWLSLGNGF